MGDLSNFERGQIVGVCLAGASVTKIATLLDVLRATVFKVMSAYMIHGKDNISEKERWAKTNIEQDCFEKSKHYCSTGDSRNEYSA
jgi:hypothetical protein